MSRRQQHGWSLVELAVVLVIVAVIGLVLARSLPVAGQLADDTLHSRALDDAEQALLGHLHGNLVLPAADHDGDGLADSGSSRGWLPTSTLGLPPGPRLRYEPHPALLQLPGNTQRPLVPVTLDSPLLTVAGRPQANLLDLCQVLLQPAADSHGHGVAAAWLLGAADPDTPDAALPLPGSVQAAGRANRLHAAGWGELGVRMDCPQRLARFNGTVQATLSAHSATRFAQFNADFRQFDIKVAELIRLQADTGLASAILGLATLVADQATLILLVKPGAPPDPAEIAKAIAASVPLIAAMAVTAVQIKNAKDDVDGAKETMSDAIQNRDIAADQFQRSRQHYEQLRQHALGLDAAGERR